jgi:hypothetical protein
LASWATLVVGVGEISVWIGGHHLWKKLSSVEDEGRVQFDGKHENWVTFEAERCRQRDHIAASYVSILNKFSRMNKYSFIKNFNIEHYIQIFIKK